MNFSRTKTGKSKEKKYTIKLRPALKIFILCFCLSVSLVSAQDDEPVTIKVRKEQLIEKAFFDNTQYRLTAIDRFGNPKENKIISYKLWIKGVDQGMNGFDNQLTGEMINELKKLKKATKIFFTDVTVQDDEGHPLKLPDVIEVWFPDCKNCGPTKKKR